MSDSDIPEEDHQSMRMVEIPITDETFDRLKAEKDGPRETWDEFVARLLDSAGCRGVGSDSQKLDRHWE